MYCHVKITYNDYFEPKKKMRKVVHELSIFIKCMKFVDKLLEDIVSQPNTLIVFARISWFF